MTAEYVTDDALIEHTLAVWFGTHTGVTFEKVRWLNQVMGRPELPYGTLQIITDPVSDGGTDSIYTERNIGTDELDTLNYGPRRMVVTCRVYTAPETAAGQDGARRRAKAAVASLRSPSVLELFRDAGLGFLQALSGVRVGDEQLGDRWERRADVDLEFSYVSLFAEKPDTDSGSLIDTIEIPTVDGGELIIQE